jgi:hypothetical protein
LTVNEGPHYGIGTSPKIDKDKTTRWIVPGPGAYDQSKRPGLNKAPAYGFGSESRDHISKNGTPGPGAYKIPVKVADVEKYSIPNQNPEFKFV